MRHPQDLEISLHDRFFGIEEQKRENYNWSATISYYGLVHGLRFLCFQCFGNFPRAHGKLASVFRGNGDVQLDWRQQFLDLDAPRREPFPDAQSLLVAHLNETLRLDVTRNTIDRLGHILTKAKKLREETNYEELLIAHQRHHVSVPGSVQALAQHMACAVREATELLAQALQAEVDLGPDIPNEERSSYRSMAFDSMKTQTGSLIEPALTHEEIKRAFRCYMGLFRFEGDRASYDELENRIGLPGHGGLFNTKSKLMTRYHNDIDEFGQLFNHD